MAVAVYTLISLGLVATSPITDPLKDKGQNLNVGLPKGDCYLSSELGHGKAVLLEDCNNLGEGSLPKKRIADLETLSQLDLPVPPLGPIETF